MQEANNANIFHLTKTPNIFVKELLSDNGGERSDLLYARVKLFFNNWWFDLMQRKIVEMASELKYF